ncbi:protein canopy homolog 2-like [Lytechinus pictus]|uniref:protein canopy homolog 2-like n=1 Tax=Lytechinus pictus TaxID=7653 RepID=UPI0030B9CBBC
MNKMYWICPLKATILTYFVLAFYSSVQAGREIDSNVYCGACRALISEVEYAISQEDPRQTITVGSFRIDPTGKQKQTKIPYAGSEAHLTEVMENVCDKMTDYAERIDPETNEKTYVRYQARNGEDMELTNVSINVVTGKILKVACENIIEEYEDEVLRLYREKSTDIETRLCSSVTQLCEGSSSAHTEL